MNLRSLFEAIKMYLLVNYMCYIDIELWLIRFKISFLKGFCKGIKKKKNLKSK
jgi:hypothetical protein